MRNQRFLNRVYIGGLGLILASSWAVSTSAYFSTTQSGVRPAGMGEAFASVSDDINTVLYNPAGFALIRTVEVSAARSELFENLGVSFNHNLVAAAVPLGEEAGTMGLAWGLFHSTLYQEHTVVLSYGRSLIPDRVLDAGISVKGLRWQLAENEYTTVASDFPARFKNGMTLDLGMLSRIHENIGFGFSVENALPADMGLISREWLVPVYRAGFSYRMTTYNAAVSNIVAAFELEMRDGDYSPRFGTEGWLFDQLIALRLGLSDIKFTTGISVLPTRNQEGPNARIDYAFEYPFYLMDTWGTHRFGLVFSWK